MSDAAEFDPTAEAVQQILRTLAAERVTVRYEGTAWVIRAGWGRRHGFLNAQICAALLAKGYTAVQKDGEVILTAAGRRAIAA